MEGAMIEQQLMVTVVCSTFNHVRFIAQALDGFLAQRTNFPIEVLVHDDASTDGTSEIIRDYAARHPGVIIPIIQPVNVYSQGKKPWLICFERARGKYIAMCEGDDHWTDPLKLQKQVDLLEADAQAVGCFTDAMIVGDGPEHPFYHGNYARVPQGPVTLARFLQGQGIAVCTMVFRRDALYPLPEQIYRSPGADTILWAHLLRHGGHYRFLADNTSVRLVHPGGIYSMKSEAHRFGARLRNMELLAEIVGPEFYMHMRSRHADLLRRSWDLAMRSGELKLAQVAWRGLSAHPEYLGWDRMAIARNYLKAHWPRTEKALWGTLDSLRGKRN
jgi:glycosyltransferase involved in cell wall biosynthesis